MSRIVLLFTVLLVMSCEEEQTPEMEAVDRAIDDAKQAGDRLASERGEEAARSLGRGVGKTLDAFVTALEGPSKPSKPAPAKQDKLPVAASAEATDAGLAPQFVNVHILGTKAMAYVVFARPFSGRLELVATDAEKREVGRAQLDVERAESTGGMLIFEFAQRLLQPASFVLSVRSRPRAD